MVNREICFICSICSENVEVTRRVTDEFGEPAHEQCYVEKLAQENEVPRDATSEQLRTLNLLRVLDDLKQHPHRRGT